MTELSLPGPFWLVGCGNMAGAMLDGWLAAGMDPAQVTVIRPSGRPVAPGVRVVTALPEDEVPAILMLGVKPQMLSEVAPSLAPVLAPETLLISILAGTPAGKLRALFPAPRTIVSAMPNLPVRIRKGVTGLHAQGGEQASLDLAGRLMAALGLAVWMEDEARFDALTTLSGCGPAFVYRFIDALARGGEAVGLDADEARRIALATAEGAALLASSSDATPAELADRVASPGGMTRKGLDVLDDDEALGRLVRRTLEAALERGREMTGK